MRTRTFGSLVGAVIAATLSALAPAVLAQEAPGGDVGVEVSTDDIGKGDGEARDGFLAAGKFGGILPFSGMSPFIAGGIELGWVFAPGNIGLFLDVSYATPKGDGTEKDARLPNGEYSWELTQKQLVLQPTFQYRLTGLGSVTPYFGIGPRVYFTESVTESSDTKIKETQERSTEWGVGVPAGVELEAGPGGVFAELLLQWGPLDHTITGDTHFGAASLFIGYRAIL